MRSASLPRQRTTLMANPSASKSTPAEQCAEINKMLADTTRWRIVAALLKGRATVNRLCAIVGASQSNVSKHLRILRNGGLVVAQREQQTVVCSIAPEFRTRDKGWELNFGCCRFRFDVAPIKPRRGGTGRTSRRGGLILLTPPR